MAATLVNKGKTEAKFHLDPSRERIVERLVDIVHRNLEQNGPPLQHVLLTGAPGSGKTTILDLLDERLAGSNLGHLVAVHKAPALALWSAAPETLLGWATTSVEGKTTDPSTFPWRGGDEAAWEEAIAGLDRALDARFGRGKGLAVLILDNFELILERVFGARDAESRFRRLLQEHPRLMIVAATRDSRLQADYDRPLFQIFEQITLEAFNLTQALELVETDKLKPMQRANFHAVFALLGTGQPQRTRMAANLAHLSKSARELFGSLMEIETPNFRQTISNLAVRPNRLLDALLIGGEPARPAALAARLETQQNDIAPTLRDLLAANILRRRPGSGGKMTFYEVEDRLFASWYVSRRKGTDPVAMDCVDVVAWGYAIRWGAKMTQAFSDTEDMVGTLLKSGSRSKAFKVLMTEIDWTPTASADALNHDRRCAAMMGLVTQPVDLLLLDDLSGTLETKFGQVGYASLLKAARRMTFLDPRLNAAASEISNQIFAHATDKLRVFIFDKDDAPHPDAMAAVRALRGEDEMAEPRQ